LKTFLHGLLVVEDKLSMAHSLETRVPFLDNDLVDFALKIPITLKLQGEGQQTNGKVILRNAMSKLLPLDIVQRKKQGFSAPDASWFRGESIDYINRLLGDKKACIYEFVSPTFVKKILTEHCSGKINHRLLIWSLLSFEWWCRLFLHDKEPSYVHSRVMTST
jgi:asparagine synthase (glutamine-hydrolysing)